MGVDRTVAFFEGIEQLARKYKQFVRHVEIIVLKKDTWYIMFHFEYFDAKIGGIYERKHLSAIGYGLLEGIEMACKQIQYRLRRTFSQGKKALLVTDNSFVPDDSRTAKKFEMFVNENGCIVWKFYE
jgi:hypothetical protein